MRMLVSRRRMLMARGAVMMGRLRVLLGLVVSAVLVMVCGLSMVMRRCLVMGCCVMVMLAGGMFVARHEAYAPPSSRSPPAILPLQGPSLGEAVPPRRTLTGRFGGTRPPATR